MARDVGTPNALVPGMNAETVIFLASRVLSLKPAYVEVELCRELLAGAETPYSTIRAMRDATRCPECRVILSWFVSDVDDDTAGEALAVYLSATAADMAAVLSK